MKPRVPKYSSGTAIRQTIYQGISSKGEVVRRHGMVFRDPCSQLLFSESERSHYKYKQLLKKKNIPIELCFFYRRSSSSFYSKTKGGGSFSCLELSKYDQISNQKRNDISFFFSRLTCYHILHIFIFLKSPLLGLPHSLFCCHCPLCPLAAAQLASLRLITAGHSKTQCCPNQVLILTPRHLLLFLLHL